MRRIGSHPYFTLTLVSSKRERTIVSLDHILEVFLRVDGTDGQLDFSIVEQLHNLEGLLEAVGVDEVAGGLLTDLEGVVMVRRDGEDGLFEAMVADLERADGLDSSHVDSKILGLFREDDDLGAGIVLCIAPPDLKAFGLHA